MSIEERLTPRFSDGFDRDLENARVLIEEVPWKDSPQKYRKVAEGILRRILTFDPTNDSAKQLLEKALEMPPAASEPQPAAPRATVANGEASLVAPRPYASPAPAKVEVPAAEAPPPRPPIAPPDFTFVVDSSRKPVQKELPKRPPWLLVALATLGAIAGLALLVTHRDVFISDYLPETPIAAPAVVQANATSVPAASPGPSPAAAPREEPALPAPIRPAPKLETVAAGPIGERKSDSALPQDVVVRSNIPPVKPIETGSLAVSSPTTVDIYMNDQLVGTAPTTLVLQAGNQTLEYRHQDLRKVMTHVIRSNETTTATVTFEATVQINAKPWAQVFIEGAKRQSLGQTPLSDVRVPIGSDLVFENPNFPGKNYRITGKETQIRVTFP